MLNLTDHHQHMNLPLIGSLAGALTSSQVLEKAAPTAYSTKLRQAAASAAQAGLAIFSTASKSHLYSRQSVVATTFLHNTQAGKFSGWPTPNSP